MADNNNERWLPSYRLSPRGWSPHPFKKMLMTPILTFVGGLFAFAATASMAALLQIFVFNPPVSNDWAPMSSKAVQGRVTFVSNGCMYCHSGFTRPQDVRAGMYYTYTRISRPGDYFGNENSPNIFGSGRWGPDLSFEGGLHPDDWQRAHFYDARFVDPLSIMPSFRFFSDDQIEDLIAFVQLRSGKSGLVRVAGQAYLKKLLLAVNNLPEPPKGFTAANRTLADVYQAQINAPSPPSGNVDGLDWPDPINLNIVDRSYWLVSNPLPVTKDNLIQGREIFQSRCIGCHGEGGAAVSEAAKFFSPPPVNFTNPDDAANGNDASPGDYYYRVLRGIPGSAMENFGSRLRVDDIWKVVMFLKTIPKGGLIPDQVPTPEMYIQWKPPSGLMTYVGKHPIEQNKDFVGDSTSNTKDPFMLEAMRLLAGLNPSDTFSVPGFGEVSLKAARNDIKRIYDGYLNAGWKDLDNRPGPKPAKDQKKIDPDLPIELR